MRIILTNDGLIGLTIDTKIVWCNSQAEALNIMWSIFGPRQQFTKDDIEDELADAIDHCAKNGHTLMEFGIFGSFIYSSKEEDAA